MPRSRSRGVFERHRLEPIGQRRFDLADHGAGSAGREAKPTEEFQLQGAEQRFRAPSERS